jgi:adenylate cyclase
MAADVVDYSRLLGEDQAATLAALRRLREGLLLPAVESHRGRVIKSMGDGWLADFPSISDAVSCAIAVQQGLAPPGGPEGNDPASATRIALRIGIHIGEVVFEGEDLFGDGVNVAARLEALARPGEVLISDSARDSLDGKTAALFGGGAPQQLKNIRRAVGVWHWPPREAPVEATGKAPAARGRSDPARRLAAREIPSIAVMPFDNLSNDPEQSHFIDGLVDDIITSLSKLSGLRVIARNSTFLYKGQSVDIAELAEKLRVRYILEGSIRKSANRIRISAQLIDAASGGHLWAERYDRALDDIFAVQDEITLILATEMQVKLTEGEQARMRYTTTDNVEAWSHWVEGLAHYRSEVTKENMAEARRCWEKALALDPGSAALNAMLAFSHYVSARFGWWNDVETDLMKAKAYIAQALELDPQDAFAHSVLGLACLLEGRFEEAAAHARDSVRLAPGSADVASFACFALAFAGYPDEGVNEGERAIDLSPNCPAVYLGHLGNAYRLAGRYDEAIEAFTAYHDRYAGFGLVDMAMIYQQSGRSDLAKQTVKDLLTIRRGYSIAAWAASQYRADDDGLASDIEALRAAGLPER